MSVPYQDKFSKLDFLALVGAKGLETPSATMAYVQDKGSTAMQAFAAAHQRRLKELLREAHEWHNARADAAAESESDWALIERLAGGECACGQSPCQWAIAAQAFFERNRASIDMEFLAATLARVIVYGPSKTVRVPMVVGPSNTGKSTVLDSLDDVFGPAMVMHTPALGATMPLATLATQRKRFLYYDEFQPVMFAGVPERAPTIPALTFMKLFSGQHLEVQVSQSFHDGNSDVRWQRGAAFTAKSEGLWDRVGNVSAEDITHMKNRVEMFEAKVILPKEELRYVAQCKASFSKWLVASSRAYSARFVPRAPDPPRQEEDAGDSGGLTFL